MKLFILKVVALIAMVSPFAFGETAPTTMQISQTQPGIVKPGGYQIFDYVCDDTNQQNWRLHCERLGSMRNSDGSLVYGKTTFQYTGQDDDIVEQTAKDEAGILNHCICSGERPAFEYKPSGGTLYTPAIAR